MQFVIPFFNNTVKNYCNLIRLSSPTGTILLFFPFLLGLTFIKQLYIPSIALFLFLSFVARSCGCILNDIADYKIDKLNSKTDHRPIACGQITIKNAIIFLTSLITISLPGIIYITYYTYIVLIFILPLVALYPYCKRFFFMPQLILGIVYASGFLISIAYVNYNMLLTQNIWIMYASLVLFVIIFDTIYAKRDILYDKQHNIKTSVKFLDNTFCTAFLLITLALTYLFTSSIFLIHITIGCLYIIFLIHKKKALYILNINLVLISILQNILITCINTTLVSAFLTSILLIIQCLYISQGSPQRGFKAHIFLYLVIFMLLLV